MTPTVVTVVTGPGKSECPNLVQQGELSRRKETRYIVNVCLREMSKEVLLVPPPDVILPSPPFYAVTPPNPKSLSR